MKFRYIPYIIVIIYWFISTLILFEIININQYNNFLDIFLPGYILGMMMYYGTNSFFAMLIQLLTLGAFIIIAGLISEYLKKSINKR